MGRKILLADDSVTIQKVVELTFAETDIQVVAVGSGSELLERFPQEKPDLVLCDVVMPDISGYEVCQRLKSDPATLQIPVVLLTGTFEPFDRDRALAAGCDAIVTKPFEARALIATVEELMARATPAAPLGGEEEVAGLGVPEGVPALDFTTTGFEKMVPPPEQPPAVPEHGLDFTASSLAAAAPPPPPPELAQREREAPLAPTVEQEAPEGFGARERTPAAASLVFPQAAEGPFAEEPAASVAELTPPAPEEAASVPEEEVETVPPGGFEEPAAAAAAKAGEDLDGLVQRVVQEVLKVVPMPQAQGPRPLADEDLERLAKKVLELATPIIERIAWDVVPDMAEMLVRQRIAELEAAAEQEFP